MRSIGLASVLLLVVGCGSGLVDEGGSVCDLAARHAASCSGLPAPGPVQSCDATAADEANSILGADCSSLASMAPGAGGRGPASESCTDEQIDFCKDYCIGLFEASNLRLRSAKCEILEAGYERPDGQIVDYAQVHCQCKGYWFPW